MKREGVLPIYGVLDELRSQLTVHNTVILEAPPGTGKSTIVPWELLEEEWLEHQKIVMLEPRRLAAKAIAARMAALLDEPLGKRVGYRIRFENKISKETRIEVVTEGILTRQLQRDNALEGVGLVIFDEFHERSLAADLALALTRESQQVLRNDLRILIMSATLDSSGLSKLLDNAPVIKAESRQYPLTYKYLPSDDAKQLPANVAAVLRRAVKEERGDILVFLPGAGEIHRTADLLSDLTGTVIHTLYGDMPMHNQQAAIVPDANGQRKIVLATSIAETSLTIEGVTIVMDSGYARVSRFDPRNGLSRLETIRVTRDAADQRAGRAGRLGPGVAYRLWSEASHHTLAPNRTPEILDADLAPLALELANWGINDPTKLAWLTAPPKGNFAQARELLTDLEALDAHGAITARGKSMLALPTHPRLAHMLIEAEREGLLDIAADIAAILEERDPLAKEDGADIGLRISALRRWRSGAGRSGPFDRIERLANNWRREFDLRVENGHVNDRDIGKLLAAAYPERVAKVTEQRGKYRLANGRSARLPDHDPLINEEWLAIAAMDAGAKEGKIYLASPLDPADVAQLSHERDVVEWDHREGVLVARRERRIGEITISTKPLLEINPADRTRVVLQAIRNEGINIFTWPDHLQQWRARIAGIAVWRPEENWPDLSDEQLLQGLEAWLAPHVEAIRKRSDIEKLDISSILHSQLYWEKSKELDRLTPESIAVPSGSQIKLEYFEDGRPPVLAVRLQEVFGLVDTPTVNGGRTKVLLHLLSPGYKPVQVTQDLRSFWKNAYPEVRKELRVRYQKHSWPEDPWTAEAVRGAKKRRS